MQIEGKSKIDILSDELLNNCIHCGLCLPTCPTYSLTGLERSSPRGRIRLMKAVSEGLLSVSEEFIWEMNFCLDCLACETACPAGVKYSRFVEAARVHIHESGYENKITYYLKRILLSWLFENLVRLRYIARIIRWFQISGMLSLVERIGILKLFSRRISDIQALVPKISKSFSTDTLAEQKVNIYKPRYRTMFLTGCIMDVAFADVNEDTIQLLISHGCEVIVPKNQGCCGSLQAHNGDLLGAREEARHNIELFSQYEFDYLVMNSAGCGAFMKDYGRIFADDIYLAEKAKSISSRVKDITEFLDETGFYPSTINHPFYGKRITYHDACHLIHAQGISTQPRKLIKSITGIDYVELPESAWCCGSAGIYNIIHYDDAFQILKRKINNIKQIHPDILVTGNPGCLLQLHHGLLREGYQVELLHTATFLRMACIT